MKLSNISTAPYRPQIKRLGLKDLPLSHCVKEFDNPSISSTKKWFNERHSQVSPELDSSWMRLDKSKKDPDNKKKLTRKVCFWVIIAIILLLTVGAIIGIIIGLTLPLPATTQSSSTSTVASGVSTISSTTAATTTVSIACSSAGRGTIAFESGTTPTTWTAYSYLFTASKTESTILFGFQTDGANSFYLDSASVTGSGGATKQLLINRDFENSTTTPTGWVTSCEMVTCGASAGRIETSALCLSGYCFESFCTNGRSALIFLGQTFTTVNTNSYTISFMLKRTNIGSSGTMIFYLDVV